MIGQGKKNGNVVHVIDYGLAKRYLCPKTGKHIEFRQNRGLIGTAKFLSLSGHQGNEHSRRDDLEALCLILIYFLNGGKLPWDLPQPKLQAIDAKDPNSYQKELANEEAQRLYEEQVLAVKMNTTSDELCKDIAPQFKLFLDYVRKLKFDEKPNYRHLKDMFTGLQKDLNMEVEAPLDWITQK